MGQYWQARAVASQESSGVRQWLARNLAGQDWQPGL